MGLCPNCQHSISDEFGLTVCEGCGVSLFVDMDGHAEMNDPQQAEANFEQAIDEPHETRESELESFNIDSGYEEPDRSVVPEYEGGADFMSPAEDQSEELFQGAEAERDNGESIDSGESNTIGEYQDLGIDESEKLATQQGEVGDESVAEEENYQWEEPNGDQPQEDFQASTQGNYKDTSGLGETSYEEEPANEDDSFVDQLDGEEIEKTDQGPPKRSHDLEDMSELADYGNSEISLGREGTLRFSLRISGIDTKELRIALRDSLEDKRFLWDIEDIMGNIKDGELTIEDLSAIKTAVLVGRLKGLPMQIWWEQNAIFKS